MSKVFTVDKNPYDDRVIYSKKSIEIKDGLTVLVGCNGSGKSTLLKYIKEQLEKDNIKYLFYDNLTDGGVMAKSSAIFYDNISLAATLMLSSEGEQICQNMCQQAQKIGKFIRSNPNAPELWILLDAIDSGLSIDMVEDLKHSLFDLILQENQNIYIVVSANEYQMCKGEQCLDVRHGKYVTFKTYNSYEKFILKSRKEKDESIK